MTHKKLYALVTSQIEMSNCAGIVIDKTEDGMKTVVVEVHEAGISEYWLYQSSYEAENEDFVNSPLVETEVAVIRIKGDLISQLKQTLALNQQELRFIQHTGD